MTPDEKERYKPVSEKFINGLLKRKIRITIRIADIKKNWKKINKLIRKIL